MGYGEAKETLYQAAMTHFGEAFERRTRFESDPDQVEDILREGAHRARAKAREVVERVRSACGLTAKPV
jgi:tryptophanyl-tRNA synthetase